MIVAIGTDLAEISRLERIMTERGDRFRDRVFTAGEIDYCETRASRFACYAARFAAKEATMKALGTGWGGGVSWREIEMVREKEGPPLLRLTGRALERFRSLGAARLHVSVSHSGDLAIAFVVFED